jgi:hypothetical protein
MEERRAPGFLESGDRVFSVTDKGIAAAIRERERPKKSRLRYVKFLEARECNEDLTFREFLTSPYYATRRQ